MYHAKPWTDGGFGCDTVNPALLNCPAYDVSASSLSIDWPRKRVKVETGVWLSPVVENVSIPQPWRAREIGRRPVRVANCSGYHGDSADEMYKQATLGNVDFITGNYLDETNVANNVESFAAGQHPGYEESAWQGIERTIDVINKKQIKVAINGGALNPKGLAEKVAELARSKGYDLKVAYITGDDALPELLSKTDSELQALPHLDSGNKSIELNEANLAFTGKGQERTQLVSAKVSIGARGIVQAFRNGVDIVICGRVSSNSLVMAAAWYWWNWSDQDYDCLAGALIAGHLIECSAYVTGGNFAGFDQHKQVDFVDPGFPVADITRDGSCIINKAMGTGGMVSLDTVRCQLLYELQGNVYLHNDVKAVLDNVQVAQMSLGSNRVHVFGIRGLPPPPTTKLGVFYKGGYKTELLLNAAGYAITEKCNLFEAQLKHFLGETITELDVFEIQRIGTPAYNPFDQNSSTMYIRVFAQSRSEKALLAVAEAASRISQKHFHGFHSSMDLGAVTPRPYLSYYPAIYPQSSISEQVHLIDTETSKVFKSFPAGLPPRYEDVAPRANYDTTSPIKYAGPSRRIRLGDIALARSGDKGGNLNVGIFVQTQTQWDWLRSYLSNDRLKVLLHDDYKSWFHIERVELPKIFAVHFVVYGILGQGGSSASRLDGFGKGCADFLRDRIVDIPDEILCHDDAAAAACMWSEKKKKILF